MFVGCATMVPRIHNTLNDNQPYLSNNITMRYQRICDISIYGSVNLKLAKVAIGFNCRSGGEGSIRRTFFSIIKPLCEQITLTLPATWLTSSHIPRITYIKVLYKDQTGSQTTVCILCLDNNTVQCMCVCVCVSESGQL